MKQKAETEASLSEILQKREAAASAVEEVKNQREALTVKAGEIRRNIPKLERLKEEAKRSKEAAYDRYVIGKLNETELEKAQQEFEAAVKAYDHAVEMLKAADRAKENLERSFPVLQNDLRRLDCRIWESVFDDLKRQIPDGVEVLLQQCWVASQGTESWTVFGNFVGTIFTVPTLSEAESIKNSLHKKYRLPM